jgi:hypothetical protein
MYPKLLENGVLQYDYENYQAWPNLKALGSKRIGGLWRAHFLKEVLCHDDLDCAAWRAPIPPEILKLLQRFPECHVELVEMAQAVPDYFLESATRNPAMALLAATYWCYRQTRQVPTIWERVTKWENLDSGQVLNFARFPYSKSFIRALAKIPIEHAYTFRIQSLRELWAISAKRRFLQHLPTVTGENLWLLSCFPPILDPAIHRLAANEPQFEEYTIQEIVSDLATRREMACLYHWPYRNRLHSWPQLLTAYNKFLHKTNHILETFPQPPIDGVADEDFEIMPLKSRTALRREAAEMSNCIESFVVKIGSLENYAYKLIRPERATVLLKCDRRQWRIEEAMIMGNEREVSTQTMKLLCQWVRNHR